MQIFLTLASTEDGSVKLLQSPAWLELVRIADEHNLVLDIVKYTTIVASGNQSGHQSIQNVLEETVSTLLVSFQDAPLPVGFFEALVDIITILSDKVSCGSTFPKYCPLNVKQALSSNPPWLSLLAKLLIEHFLSRLNASSAESRYGLWVLTATMLRLYPESFPSLLFSSGMTTSSEPKPKSILLLKLIVVDIKSSIPSLQESLNSPQYPRISTRIACSYDVISAFIGYLVHILDEESSQSHDSKTPLIFSPSLLLQLRSDIAETMSLTIEHLRDRFDASVAGAMGLHPSARAPTEPSGSAPLAITWDSSLSPMPQDHLTLAQIQTLALWLHEDDNDNLRKEAAGITDVLLSLYTSEDTALQFQSPVLMSLESIIVVPEGTDAFLAADGWTILAKDLQTILLSNHPAPAPATTHRGIDIVRVLLDILQSDTTGPSKADWMDLVELAAAEHFPTHDPETLDLRIAVAQLAVELLSRAPRGVRRRNLASAKRLLSGMKGLRSDENVLGEAREGVDEVVAGLEELGVT